MTFDVAHQMASARQRRTVGLLCLAVCLSALLVLPVASLQLPAMPHIAGIYGAAAAMINLASFWMLMSAPRPSRPLRIVAAAYLYAALMAVLYVLSFPAALLPEGSVFGNSNAASWLFIGWRMGFAAFILWAVLAEVRASKQPAGNWPPAGVAVAAAALGALAALAASEVPSLVSGPQGQKFGALSAAGAYAGGLICCITAVLVFRFGLVMRSLYLWLMLVLLAETVGVLVSTSSGGRYTVAWYGARVEGLSASAIMLVLLAAHLRDVQSRLATAVVHLSERTDALQAEMQHRERAERMVAQSQKLEAVGQLAAGLAHDINNFMHVVGMRAEIIKRRFGPAVEGDVAVIQRNVLKAQHLTRQLLLFAGRRQLQSQTLHLQRRVREVVDIFQPVLGERVGVQLDLPDDAWTVHADPTELEIALVNLLTNARDALPAGGRITVRLANLPAEGGRGERVRLEVSDDGSGMPPAVRERVFDPFFTTKAPGKGSGLGLSQVYAFVQASGGEIAIDSEVGCGTTVRIDLPRLVESEVGAGGPAAAPARALTGGVVLIVDDNPDVLESTSALLLQSGLAVRMAADAREALALLDAGLRPDVLVSDIVMPGDMDGVALARQARLRCAGLRVVLATGYSAEASEAREQGFLVLHKPYDAQQLLQALRV